MTKTFSPLHPTIVLGIVAHPDDIDVGAGGTMAAFARGGAEIHYLILTDGGKGSDDPNMTSAQLTKIRRQEQRQALQIIGGNTAHFLEHPDGELQLTMELKKEIVSVIRSIKPDVVVTMDPTLVYSAEHGIINHPDHRAAGQATLDAVFPLARDALTFPELLSEGLLPHKTLTLLMINFDGGNFPVDITKTIDLKIQAMRAHASQFGDIKDTTWLYEMAKRQAHGTPFELAENFIRIDIR